jgi:FlaA1/EpsC-like NDP-sugar epimerase
MRCSALRGPMTGSLILLLGRAADAEVLLRAIESGAVKKIWPVGILSPTPADQGQSVRRVAVISGFDDLERVVAELSACGQTVSRVVLTPSALDPQVHPEAILMKAMRPVSRIEGHFGISDSNGPGYALALRPKLN